MNEKPFEYYICSVLPANPESPASVGAKVLNTLDALSSIDPALFANWQILDFNDVSTQSLAMARPRIAAILEHNVTRDDFDRPRLAYGYQAMARTGAAEERRQMLFEIQTGGEIAGDAWLFAGDRIVAPDPEIVT